MDDAKGDEVANEGDAIVAAVVFFFGSAEASRLEPLLPLAVIAAGEKAA